MIGKCSCRFENPVGQEYSFWPMYPWNYKDHGGINGIITNLGMWKGCGDNGGGANEGEHNSGFVEEGIGHLCHR